MTLQRFLALPPERQEAILQACLEEFAAQGYEQASTNRMVERAGVSKGVLFKYFGSKEELFLFLYRRAAERVKAVHAEVLAALPDDPFAALEQIARHQFRLQQEEPLYWRLLEQVQREPAHPVHQRALAESVSDYQALLGRLREAMARGPLRPGVDLDRAMQLAAWAMEGLRSQYLARWQAGEVLEAEAIVPELRSYFELLKHGLYER
jgi:TetR/AcrR family transcriptional regulator